MEKNNEYIGEVLSLGSEGEGIIKIGEETAFVPFCLAGERVTFKALKASGKIAYGKLTEVHTLSPDRVTPPCPYFEKCGGCQLQHAAYSAQLTFKKELVKNCIKKIGGLDIAVENTVASPVEYGYRNKLALPVGVDGDGNTVIGFYALRSHRIVPIKSCPLQAEWSGALISALSDYIKESGLKGYDERTRKGDIRHLVAREVDGKFIITVVAASTVDLSGFADRLDGIFKKFTLWLNINNSTGNAVYGKTWRLCRGAGYFSGEDCGIKFKAGAQTFLQVNDGVRKALYERVVSAADGNAVVIDLYSGGGMLTAMLAKRCRAAYGIEIVPEAVACADELKALNGLGDKMFNLCGAVEDRIDEVLSRTAGYARIIVCDPPRKGMERSVVKAVLASGAEKVILVSCNPATLARDLGLLCGSLKEVDGQIVKNEAYVEGGVGGFYSVEKVIPFDMFPQTKHIETLVSLSRK